ncbi:hypothetical protein ACLKA7_001577 [Drosophila subpalustris]
MLNEVLSKVLTFPAVNPPVFAGLTPPAELEPYPESMFGRDSGRLGSCSLISGRITLLLRPSLDLVLLTRLFLGICSSVGIHNTSYQYQTASVAVSSWTLVAISCERYYAICHPLRSRTWQTINHANKIIAFIWLGSLFCMTPIAVFSQLMPTSRQGLRKCREQWPAGSIGYELSYNIFLVLILLVLPLLALIFAYLFITRTLYVSMRNERDINFGNSSPDIGITSSSNNRSFHKSRRAYGNSNKAQRDAENMEIESASQLNFLQQQKLGAPQYYYALSLKVLTQRSIRTDRISGGQRMGHC